MAFVQLKLDLFDEPTGPDLAWYDWILVNSSAGKDSQAMLDFVVEKAKRVGVSGRVVVAHADLGRMEWKGTKELAAEHAAHYGLRFEVVRRTQERDLLEHIRRRGMFPGMGPTRYCTSDHKRGPIRTLWTRLADEKRGDDRKQIRILNCMGMRAEESPARAKKQSFCREYENGMKLVDQWLPIHSWTAGEVWNRIKRAGTRHHWAYDLGMPRLSCCLCIYSNRDALLLAGYHNRELLRDYVAVEDEIGHRFREDVSVREIQAILDGGYIPANSVADWEM